VLGGRRPVRSPLGLALACAALAAALAAALYWLGPPGVDEPAHVYSVWWYRGHGFAWWSNDWYSGRYAWVTYSILFDPIAALVGIGPLTVAAAAILAGAAAAACAERYGVWIATGPCLLLAVTVTFNTVVSGAYPFLSGAAGAALALLAAERGWRVGFVLAVVLTFALSPLALALLVAILAGFALAAGLGRTLRDRVVEALGLALVVAVGAVLQLVFTTGGRYPYGAVDLLTVTAFCIAGIALAGARADALGLRLAFAVYLALNLAAYLASAPIGSNAERLFLEAGVPLLWLAARVGHRRSRVVPVILAAALVLQMQIFVRDFATSASSPSTSEPFWRPAVGFLRAHPDSQHRVEVVASWGHWEADFLPEAGVPLARGWFRQDDWPQNAVLYRSRLTAAAYTSWLRAVGVRYVFLPDGPLDYSAEAEARLLRSGRSGLRDLGRRGRVRVFELLAATPIVTGPGRARLQSLDGGRVEFTAAAAGRYLVRVRYTRFWSGAPVAKGPRSMTWVTVTRPGTVRLAVSPGG
jgi:hypothetical protein